MKLFALIYYQNESLIHLIIKNIYKYSASWKIMIIKEYWFVLKTRD